ncbi:MAG: PP2C family protein-serine/threonine phosphatase [Ignavibacteria bacterium]|nr:PP2C family protein-serine/threonine phosphatase [Ignavibacteria bacterium]
MMNQRRLYRTIESFAHHDFKTDKELLKHVLNEIVKDEVINIKGGRIWQYEPATDSYRLIHQIGVIERLEPGYKIGLSSYPIFYQLADHRSVIANETDRYLRKKGIVKYSATAVGEKIDAKKGKVPQYILAFNSDKLEESLLADLNIISLAVTALLRGKKVERKAYLLEKDLDKAREIQQSILPQHALNFYHYELYGVSIPDRVVGGDFFDYLLPNEEDDRLSVVIGDAASKGFRAAAQALYVSGALRMGISYHTKISALMSRLNKLVNKTFAEEQFVTMFYAELSNDPKGLLLYSNAGHNSPMVYRALEKRIDLLEATGQIMGPFPDGVYKVDNTHLNKGDVVVLYTDGVVEAVGGGAMYGDDRLEQSIKDAAHLTAKEICQRLLDDVLQYSSASDDGDDKTIVVIKRLNMADQQ